MTTDELVENPTWAANLALRSALGILAKTGFGDDCCDNDGCCMFYGSRADDIAARADGLEKPLTFAEAAELERKAAMFEGIARTIREVLAKFPPQ